MADYSQFSREDLIKRIEKLENLTQAFIDEKDKEELLNFSWTGNLGHWYWDFPNNKVIHNPLKVEVLGYTMEEIPDDLDYNFFTDKLHPDDYNRVMQVMREHLQGKRPVYEVEYRIQTKSGEYKHFYDRGKVTKTDQAGKPILLAGIVFDITEKKRAEEQLYEKNVQLQEAIRTRDKLFAIISHDLKKGFQHLMGFPELILDRFEDYSPTQIREMIRIVKNEAESTYSLLENLFEWSKSQRGALTFQPQWVDMKEVVEENFLWVQNKADASNITLRHSIEPEHFRIFADPNMLRTVVRNLLDNALKFSVNGGKIEVSAQRDPDTFTLSVQDEGVGIPEELRDKLFRIDQDVSRPGVRKEKGSGLGLLVCKEFVELHGGDIRVDPAWHPGTRILVTIPINQDSSK